MSSTSPPTEQIAGPEKLSTDDAGLQTPAERRAVRWVVGLVVGLVCIALVQIVGSDVYRFVSRTLFRTVVRKDVVHVGGLLQRNGQFLNSQSDAEADTRLPGSDANVVPPRRKKQAEQNELVQPAEEPPKVEDAAEAARRIAMADPNPALVVPPLPVVKPVDEPQPSVLDQAAKLASRSPQDFDYPVSWPAGHSPKSRMLYVSHRNRLLKAVTNPHPTALSLDQLRKDYVEAVALFNGDPRLEYVYGLALWRHERQTEAIEQFQIAARIDGMPFIPAALAVAWGRFLLDEDKKGLEQLISVARRLGDSDGPHPTDAQKESAAMAMGRALGYLSGPGNDPDLAKSVDLTQRNVLEFLGPTLLDACQTGQDQVASRQSELSWLSAVPTESLQGEFHRQEEELADRMIRLRQEMQDARNSLERDHKSHLSTISQMMRQVANTIGQGSKFRRTIEKMKETVAGLSAPTPRKETKYMPSHFDLVRGRDGQFVLVEHNAKMIFLTAESAEQRAARIERLGKAKANLKKIEFDFALLRDQQRDLIAKRHEAESQHKEDNATARRLRLTRLQEQKELDEKLKTLTKSLRQAMALYGGLDSIAAYVPWNIEIEAEALSQAWASK